MEDYELISLNQEGLFPGPGESEKEFFERICSIKKSFSSENAPAFYPSEWAGEQLHFLFDFHPRWIKVFFSSNGLALWEAGATWIGEKGLFEIQLRKKGWIDRIICREEVLAHESVHAVRASFEESRHEEIFAYMTSSTSWRRVLGPLFFKSTHALLFVLALCVASFFEILQLFFSDFSGLAPFLFLFPTFLLLKEIWALFRARSQLKKAGAHLTPLLKDPRNVRAVLFRLTSSEIKLFAKGSIANYISKQEEIRWKLLKKVYF